MNCNKKSHFDGVTPVHRQGGGGCRIWLCLCLQGGGALAGLGEQDGTEEGKGYGKRSEEERRRERRGEGLKRQSACGGCELKIKKDRKRKSKKK